MRESFPGFAGINGRERGGQGNCNGAVRVDNFHLPTNFQALIELFSLAENNRPLIPAARRLRSLKALNVER